MTRIIGTNIQYTAGDTFRITVSGVKGFATGDKLRLEVKASEEAVEKVINKQYELTDDVFIVSLSNDEASALALGDYVYRLTYLKADGTVITTVSGRLIVQWGY